MDKSVTDETTTNPIRDSTINDLIMVKKGKTLVPVRPEQVLWIAAAGNYVSIHTDAESFTVRATLDSMLRTLRPDKFVRIHKSAVINLDALVELQPWFSGEMRVVLKDQTMLKLSRTYRQQLEKRLRFLS